MSAGNHLQFGPDGKARFKSGKALFAADGTPCCCTPPCSLCNTNGSPSTVLVRFAGFSVPAGCITTGGTLAWTWNTFDINHDFCLPVCPVSACSWIDAFTGRVDIDVWNSSATCTGPRDGNSVLLGIEATIKSSLDRTWDVRVLLIDSYTSSNCTRTGPIVGLTGYAIRASQPANAVDHCLDTVTMTAPALTNFGIVAGTIQVIPNGC